MKSKLFILITVLMVIFSLEVKAGDITDERYVMRQRTYSPGLMWQKEDDKVKRNWKDAKSYCENLSLAGHDDWRLPTLDELRAIAHHYQYNPEDNKFYLMIPDAAIYWSLTRGSKRHPETEVQCWNFDTRKRIFINMSRKINVICVRGIGPRTKTRLDSRGRLETYYY